MSSVTAGVCILCVCWGGGVRAAVLAGTPRALCSPGSPALEGPGSHSPGF